MPHEFIEHDPARVLAQAEETGSVRSTPLRTMRRHHVIFHDAPRIGHKENA